MMNPSTLALAMTLWDALGDDIMIEAFTNRSGKNEASWRLHTGPLPDNVDVMHLNDKTFIRCRLSHIEPPPPDPKQLHRPNEDHTPLMLTCPYCQERAYPESDCVACTKYICGNDPTHIFSIWRRRTD